MANEDAEYWNTKGDEFYNVENYEEAIKCYAKAAQINPDDAYILKNWGDALANLAEIKKDETLYRKAFEKYNKASKINPNNADVLSFWGNALINLADIKQDESLYRESFEKFKRAAKIDPNDAFTFKSFGNALVNLANINHDEKLYREAFEKYEQAAKIDPNNTYTFSFWGYALFCLAKIKYDETLYYKAFEKFEQAAGKDPSNAFSFSSWGNALSDLAEIKKDESLYLKAFEKYDLAIQKNPDNAIAFNNWGYALADLAKIKQDESLFREALEKFKLAIQKKPDYVTAVNNWGYVLAAFTEITQDKELIKSLFEEFYRESDSLKKLKKDILGIFIIFNKKNMREITDDKKIFFPLLELNLENDDSSFFNKITKGITDTEELNKYKMAYILSVLIISQLHINNENEKSVAYYTKITTSQAMLFNNAAFRLNAINYSNDPTEGKILLDYLFGEGKYPTKEINTGYGTFAGCFTFNHDSLNQFRLYGKTNDKEGTGLSLVFKDTFFSEEAKMAVKQDSVSVEDKQQALFRCIYIDPVTRRVETVGHKEAYLFYRENNDRNQNKTIDENIKIYRHYINGIIENIKHEMEELQKLVKDLKPEIIGQLLINLRYLTKHIAFKEEQECRIIKIHPLNDKKMVKINTVLKEDNINDNININNIKQLYIDYQNITGHVDKIYFGPNAANMPLFQDLLRYKDQNIPCEKSKNPLHNETNFRKNIPKNKI